MQNNMERKEGDTDKVLNKNMTDMGKGSQKESNTNDNKFMKMVEATSNAYSEALKKLAEGEPNDR